MTDDAADIGPLPDVLARIAGATSRNAALRLAHDFGGREIYLPEKLGDLHPLTASIGRQNAEKVIRMFGAGRLLVPLGPTSDGRRKAELIARMLGKNHSRADIAARLRIHVRTVTRHRRRAELGDANQPDLFPSD